MGECLHAGYHPSEQSPRILSLGYHPGVRLGKIGIIGILNTYGMNNIRLVRDSSDRISSLNDIFIISHTTWTKQAIVNLFNGKPKPNSKPISNKLETHDDIPNRVEYMKLFNTVFSDILFHKIKGLEVTPELSLGVTPGLSPSSFLNNLIRLVDAINGKYHLSSEYFLHTNHITYTRNTDTILFNHITGHTIGGSKFREYGINVEPSYTPSERKTKLIPSNVTSVLSDDLTKREYSFTRKVYYFDFGSSAGYNLDYISSPCFVRNANEIIVLPKFGFRNNKPPKIYSLE